MKDQRKDQVLPFDEYPECEMCGGNVQTERLTARDGSRIVSCDKCGLWFTSPRIEEDAWVAYLRSNNPRNVEFTENRLKYGVALTANVKTVLPGWRKAKAEEHRRLFRKVEAHLGHGLARLHDAGCGVGLLLQDAVDLNSYAQRIMCDELGLEVSNQKLPALEVPAGSYDAVFMTDYIEHTYHPRADLEAAALMLAPGGVICVRTFHIDCRSFDRLGESWNMLFWNHVYHFSTETLTRMMEAAGFRILEVDGPYKSELVTVLGSKSEQSDS
jgi:hypothetical protein